MSWQGILGHDEIVDQFRRSLTRGRLASTFLFVGPSGVGKRAFAEKLAQSLLCQRASEEQLAPCGTCDSCVQTAALVHPDLYVVQKRSDKSSILIEQLVGDDAHRMREGLCHDLALKPFMGGRKVAIIDDADYLGEESANCLLKTLEEPPPRSVLILIGTSAERQLPTIRSRCQIVRFRPLPPEVLAEVLIARGLVADSGTARRLAEFAEGSVQRAVELADEDLWAFRSQLLKSLARVPLESVELANALAALADAAGKDASARRARLKQAIAFAVDFHRQLLRARLGMVAEGDAELVSAVQAASNALPGDATAAAHLIDRSLVALAQVDRNAHQAAVIECWSDDLARIAESGRPAAAFAE